MRECAPQFSDGWRHWGDFREDDAVRDAQGAHTPLLFMQVSTPTFWESNKSIEVIQLPEQTGETLGKAELGVE